jgi:hypothetical protein
MEWKHTSSFRNKKLKIVPSAGTVILMMFSDFDGPILEHYQDCGRKVSSTCYGAMFAIQSKYRGTLTNGIVLFAL